MVWLDVWKCGWHSVVIQTYWIWIDRFLSLQTLSQLMRPSISPQDSVESWNTSPSQSRVWRLRAFLLQWKMCWRRFWPHHHLRLVALQRKDFKTSKIESNRIKGVWVGAEVAKPVLCFHEGFMCLSGSYVCFMNVSYDFHVRTSTLWHRWGRRQCRPFGRVPQQEISQDPVRFFRFDFSKKCFKVQFY